MWSRLKSIFSSKTSNDIKTLSLDFNREVELAISLLASHDNINTDEEVVQLLLDNGIGRDEAIEILIFLPIAFVRHWLPMVEWQDSYLEYIDTNKTIERKFSASESFQTIWQVTAQYFTESPQKDTVIKIGGRSAEFKAINKLLLENPDSKLENIQVAQTVLIR